MIIGIPKEIQNFESRVSATPETVKKFIALNHKILIERGAGLKSHFSDKEYEENGAGIVDSPEELYNKSDIIIKINLPEDSELSLIKNDSTLISFCQIKDGQSILNTFVKNKVTFFSMNHIPRTTLAQKMDALSSQSNIAGYKAVIIGSDLISNYMPLLMTAAGTIQPAKVLILGAGVAGLSAIATAKRLGSQVFAFDVRPVVKEQVESLGAKFIEVQTDDDEGTGEGGYAKEVSEGYKKKQTLLIEEEIKKMDLVISTALIPERPAPILINDEMVSSMKKGSVIMDLAAINGGNCTQTKLNETTKYNGIIINGMANLPSTMPAHASQLYAKNIFSFFNHVYSNKENLIDEEEEITKGALLLKDGAVKNEAVNKVLNNEN